MRTRAYALAIALALASGCAAQPGARTVPPETEEAEEISRLEQRIIELASTQADLQNELQWYLQEADALKDAASAAESAIEKARNGEQEALTAIETLVACLGAQQNWISLLTKRIEGETTDRATAERAVSDMNAACSEAQRQINDLNRSIADR